MKSIVRRHPGYLRLPGQLNDVIKVLHRCNLIIIWLLTEAIVTLDEMKVLMPFVTAGDPDLDTTEALVLALAEAGAITAIRTAAVTALVLATMVVWAALGYGDGNDLALAVALYSVGRPATHHIHSAGAVAGAVCISTLGTVVDPNQRVDLLPAIVLTVVPTFPGSSPPKSGSLLRSSSRCWSVFVPREYERKI